jgi:hypothetical protein
MISLSINTLPEAARVAVLATPIVVTELLIDAESILLPTVAKALVVSVVVTDGPVEPPHPPAPQPVPNVKIEPPVVA